jgi:hypothetical protein
MPRAVRVRGVTTRIACCGQGGLRHRSDCRVREVDLEQVEKGRIATGGHFGFDDLRRSVDLRVSRTSCRNISFGLIGLNDRFSEGYGSICMQQPARSARERLRA